MTPSSPKAPFALLTDFDGTVSLNNAADALIFHFGTPECRAINERWLRGEISTQVEIETCFNTFHASRQEMEAFLDTIELDPGFSALLAYCRQEEAPVAIVSDGFKWYIDYILRRNRISGVEVYACDILFTDNGFRYTYPWFDPQTPLRSTGKPAIVRCYQQQGYRVVYLGDGNTDIEAARVADLTFARDALVDLARRENVPVNEFDRMGDLLPRLKAVRWQQYEVPSG